MVWRSHSLACPFCGDTAVRNSPISLCPLCAPAKTRFSRFSVCLQGIQRTFHPTSAVPQHMRVNHGRRHIFVSKQLLNGSDVCVGLQRVCREAVSKGVAAHPLCNPRPRYCRFDPSVDCGFIEMMSSTDLCSWIQRQPPRGKHILPTPLARSVRIRRITFACALLSLLISLVWPLIDMTSWRHSLDNIPGSEFGFGARSSVWF